MIYKNLNQAFVEQLSHLKSSGNIVNSRGSKQIEITFVNMVIEDPTQLDIEVPIRKFNKDYAIGEWLWYISGNQKSNNIGKIASIWKDISRNNIILATKVGWDMGPHSYWYNPEYMRKKIPKLIKPAWFLASCEDFNWPMTEGKRSNLSLKLSHYFMDKLAPIAPYSKELVEAFLSVANLVKSPIALAHPIIIKQLITYKLFGAPKKNEAL